MARASAPPWEPTPSCRIAAPSLSARSRLETFSQKLFHLDGSDLFRVNFTLVDHYGLSWDFCGDILRFCERSNPLFLVKYFGSGVFLFHQEHELRMDLDCCCESCDFYYSA